MLLNSQRETLRVTHPGPALFVFDGDCGICTKSVAFLKFIVEADLAFLPYQLADLEALGLTAEDCERAAQLVLPGEAKVEGYDSFRVALRRSQHHVSRGVARVMGIPLVKYVGRFIYSRVAQGRRTGVLGDIAGACVLPGSSPTQPGSREQSWQKLAFKMPDDARSIDALIGSREQLVSRWRTFRFQALIVVGQWAVGGLLLSMRLVYDVVIGYGWGWQMFS